MRFLTKADKHGWLRTTIAIGLAAALAAVPRHALGTMSLAGITAHSPDDISGFSTLTGDNNTASVTLPFTFTVEGTNFTTLVLSTNGWIEFGTNTSGSSDPANACLPVSNHTNPFLAAYWDDLNPFGTNIRYGTVGTSPNRTFIADYEVDLVSGSEGADDIRFQVQLHERSNMISVRYRDQQSATNAIAATIGFQGAGGGSATTVQPLTCNGKILDDNRPNEGWSADVGRAGLVTLAAVTMHSPDDITGFTTLTGDEATANVTLPFTVTIEGTNYTTLTLSTNGWLEFGGNTSGGADFTNGCLPVANHTNPFLAAYWDDLNPFGTIIRYGTVGAAGNRTFIADYETDLFNGEGADDVRFQIQIHERSSLVSVRYRDAQGNANGQLATIGFQGAGGSAASAYPITCNGKVLDDNLSERDGWSVHPKTLRAMSLHSILAHSPDDITGFATITGDSTVTNVGLPFSFNIDGTNYGTIAVSTNGWIEFGGNTSGSSDPVNACLPVSNHTNPLLAPYWDDMTTASTNIRHGVVGTSPNRTYVLDFYLLTTTGADDSGNDDVAFQVLLHETSNTISVKYSLEQGVVNGQNATIGFQGAGGSGATAYPLTCNGKILDDNRNGEGWSVAPLPICGNSLIETKEQCDQGGANGSATSCCSSVCAFKVSGTTCRASAGTCDIVETCTGSSAICPADAFQSSSTPCRAAAGECDLAENCPGNAAACPGDAKKAPGTACTDEGNECTNDQCDGTNVTCQHPAKPNGTACTDDGNVCTTDTCQTGNCSHPAGNAGTPCRASAGVCDVAETCDGVSPTCPADGFVSSSTPCRGSAGICDVVENCTGSSAACPADGFQSSSTPCRGSAGICDVVENCTGSSAACPADGFQSSSTPCRGSAGICDVVENCTGSSATCPADGFQSSSTPCRGSAGICDVAENCTGSSAACPADAFEPSSTTCRGTAGACDVAENCTGSSATCPADAFEPSSVVCRPDAGECDLADSCTGSSAACPADAKKPNLTPCTDDGNPCSLDRCDGTNVTCQHPAGNAGAICRASAGVCDVAETCTGSSTVCPADAFEPTTTECRASGGECDPAEVCPGGGPSCPADARDPAGTSCSTDGNPCTVDQCDGTNVTCQHPAGNAGTICRTGSGDACDPDEVCTGASPTCPADVTLPGFTCRPAAGECDVAENCGGLPTDPCPADAKKPSGSLCTSDGNPCSLDECNGTSDACQHPAGNAGATCRAAAGICDVDETCTGASTVCPADAFEPSSVVCRSDAGECDLAESCTGSTATCPADAKKASGTACTDDGNPCSLDQCNGTSDTCQHPAGNAGAICRSSSGVCDVAETCTGASTVCPADGFEPTTTECRASAGECDPAENCPGTGPTCPADAKEPAGTGCTDDGNPCSLDQCDGTSATCQHPAGNAGATCRASAGDCDVIETCTGASTVCPADAFASSSTVCRASGGECDLTENCPGTGPTCPADAKEPAGSACTDDGNPCSLDQCDGTNDACQHPAGNAGTTCRASAGDCDVIETCTGASTACPPDGFVSSSTVCRPASGGCDVAESCPGSGPACPPDAVASAGTVCRAAAGTCDVQESCDGTSPACPPDAFQPASTVCRAAAGVCDVAESCTGSAAACPGDAFAPSSQVCRAAIDVCDVTENCTGAGAACPADAVRPTTTECRASTDVCDPAENCDGTNTACPIDMLLSDGTVCSDGSACTVNDICVAGMCVGDVGPDICLDDFNCYQARVNLAGGSFASVTGVSLVDEFETVTATISRPKLLCPPANKNGEGVVDEDTHLVAYTLRQSPLHSKRTGIKVTNQLGSLFVDTQRPDSLLVPTAKDLLASPPAPDLNAIDVDHYKCYRIRVTKGTLPFPTPTIVSVTDQFDEQERLFALSKPRRLCNPVDKNGEGIKNPAVHLMCYQARPSRGERRHVARAGLYTNNQFGPLRLNTLREREFCIPSVMTVTP